MIQSISQSLMNTWGMCPERVRRRYFLNDVIPPGIAARIGTGVHAGAEVNHKAKMKTKEDEPLDVIKDAARDGYVEALNEGVFFPPEEVGSAKTQMADGLDVTVSLAGLYHNECAPQIQPVYVEEKIIMDVEGLQLPMSGIIDVLDETWWLPDLKTAARRYSQADADSKIQPTLYNELIKYKTGEYPTKLSFEVFVKNKKPVYQSIETTRTQEDFEVLKLRAKIMMQSINAGLFPPADPGFWGCSPKWCGYFYTCPHIPAHKKILPKAA